jgi:3-phosphoshikimate 1-carboxyvinyltransferase
MSGNTPSQITIEPIGPFDTTVQLPGSKSLTNRALLIAALAKGRSKLTGVLFADDTRRMIEALQALGFKLNVDEDNLTVTVHGKGGHIPADEAELFLGNAGTATRFLTAACCLGLGTYTIDGIPRMRERPIGQLVDPLIQMGAEIEYLGEPGFPPLKIIAEPPGLLGGLLELEPTLSSQYLSALCIAAPYMERGLEIEFDGPITSLPYLKMTLNLMHQFGVESEADTGYEVVHIGPGRYKHYDYPIEPDASTASYFLGAAALIPGSRCIIENLGSRSLQGDAEFCDVLGRMGCGVEQQLGRTEVTSPPSGRLRGIEVDLNHMPDMAQTLAVIALFADGPTSIHNVGNLRVKETDRMAALEKELAKLGAQVMVMEDSLVITPPLDNRINPATIETYDDHRMAMAFALAGLVQPGVTIDDPGCVAKTFPDYFEKLTALSGAEPALS